MKTFVVPVVLEVWGYALIQAETLEEAQQECERLSKDGIEINAIEDTETYTEVFSSELSLLDGEKE